MLVWLIYYISLLESRLEIIQFREKQEVGKIIKNSFLNK
jgi:hypothetical protein